MNRYGKPLDLTDFAAYIVQNIKQLENIFGKDYSKDRNVDRALWVYGHCFKKG